MPSIKSVLPKYRHKVFKRGGTPSKVEKQFVAQFVADQPAEITPQQVTSLAKTMRRSKDVIRAMIDEAKDNFHGTAKRYVEIHKEAVEAALAAGTEKALQVAVQGAQWAMENISSEGTSIIGKKADTGSQAGKILIGIQIGGLRDKPEAEVVEAEKV